MYVQIYMHLQKQGWSSSNVTKLLQGNQLEELQHPP